MQITRHFQILSILTTDLTRVMKQFTEHSSGIPSIKRGSIYYKVLSLTDDRHMHSHSQVTMATTCVVFSFHSIPLHLLLKTTNHDRWPLLKCAHACIQSSFNILLEQTGCFYQKLLFLTPQHSKMWRTQNLCDKKIIYIKDTLNAPEMVTATISYETKLSK